MEKGKSVGIWIRVSTEDQARGESPEHHEKRARGYAEARGWNVKEIYRLEAVSGKSVMDHPETRRMLADIRSENITGLIFSKLARLARNTKELLDFAEIFNECHADLISLQEAIDTTTPAGRLFYTMIAAMAQWEREEIAERVAASVPIRAKLGKPLSGASPFGYRWVDKKLVIDPKEAPVRKLMYELFLEHKRKKTVARLLNSMGYRTREGYEFGYSTVYRLLRDPSAKGMRRANYTKRVGKNYEKTVLKPQEEWIFSPVSPIVSEELWNECNRIIEEQLKHNKRPAKRTVHLFTGIAGCQCGGTMYVPSNSPKYICKKCRNKIGTADLEVIFQEQLKSFLFSEQELSQYLQEADSTVKDKERLFATLTEEKKKVREDMDSTMQLYLKKAISELEFNQYFHPLEERMKQIQDQLPELQAEVDFLKIQSLSSQETIDEARDLYSRWQTLTFEEKRKIIETITEKIIVDKTELTISLAYFPSSTEMAAEWHRSPRRRERTGSGRTSAVRRRSPAS